MPVAAVIFDFDGVLADTERLHLGAFQEVFAERHWALDESVYFDRYLGYDDEGLVRAFSKDQALALDEGAIAQLVRAKTEIFSRRTKGDDVLFAGAEACVTALARQFPLGIASGAMRLEITSILGAGNLLAHFNTIVAADDVEECKPSPMPYLTAAARLGVDPRACVAIEDSLPGIQAARAAGMRTIGVTSTLPRALLGPADEIIDALPALSPRLVEAVFERAGRVPGQVS